MTETVVIEKLVHGGQGIGTLADGRRVFAWNALPGETVQVRLTKSKNKLAEGVVEEITDASGERETPKDAAYLSTSPWQMMSFPAENKYKQQILTETMQREHVVFSSVIPMVHGQEQWHYRNKMEYSFWADDFGLHLALFNRGTHQKQIVEGSSIAMPLVNETAQAVVKTLNAAGVRGSQLKSVVIRADQSGQAVVGLFVKDESFPKLKQLSEICKGTVVYYSTPKSPASVITKQLYIYGDITLSDTMLGSTISYDVNSFFQVNVGVFQLALKSIKKHIGATKPIVDMYAGTGTIGVAVNAHKLVEIDAHNIAMAQQNIGAKDIKIIHASAEGALSHIPAKGTLVVDPPRAGLHSKVIEQIREAAPSKIIYLSCNPITQARDLALLQDIYKITAIEGYNFFPRTPHIESLAVLERI